MLALPSSRILNMLTGPYYGKIKCDEQARVQHMLVPAVSCSATAVRVGTPVKIHIFAHGTLRPGLGVSKVCWHLSQACRG